MEWQLPPKLKVYEALGAIADGRVELTGSGATVYSSARKRAYTIERDLETGAIASNDNASYWHRQLGYPVIAYLITAGRIDYDPALLPYLRDYSWGTLNTRFKRNYPRLEAYVESEAAKRGLDDPERLQREARSILRKFESLKPPYRRSRTPPPE